MPQIDNLEKTTTPKREKKPLLNVHRDEIFYREDIKWTFTYAIIGVSALAILFSIGYMGAEKLRK